MSLPRGAAAEAVAYALVLGSLAGLPGAVAFGVDRFSGIEAFPGLLKIVGIWGGMIAVGGTVPAVIAAGIVWLLIRRRHRDGPLPDGTVMRCWAMTLFGSYLLVPLWVLGIAIVEPGCQPGGCERPMELAGNIFILSLMGTIISLPYVAPVMYLGVWIWVRKLRPRLSSGAAKGVMTFGT